MLRVLLLVFVVASWLYWLIACILTRRFLRHRPTIDPTFKPSVSILKPLKGLDEDAFDNFATFCRQDYAGPIELLFGVADPNDPAIPLIHRLQAEFPSCNIRLIMAPTHFLNPKVGNLHNLAAAATSDILVLSDGDIRVTPDYLSRVVAPLQNPSIGVVTCPYRGASPKNLPAILESLYINTQFLPSTVVAHQLFAARLGLGATIAIRRADLERIGGFPAIADYLADDFQLASRIADLGLKIYLFNCVVDSVLGRPRLIDQFRRELRWFRCIRVSAPFSYPGLLLTFSTPLSFLLLIFSAHRELAQIIIITSILLRWLTMWHLQPRKRDLVWLPIRDFLTACMWCIAFVGRSVTWRGQRFRVLRDGRLATPDRANSPGIFRRSVQLLDALLRRLQNIYEYSHHPDCAFRISVIPSGQSVTLSNNTHITPRDTVGELHLWNEHLPPIPSHGADLDWAVRFGHQLTHSMQDLARHAKSDPRFANVKAIHGRASSITPRGIRQLERLADHFGFELIPVYRTSRLARLHDRAEDLLIWLLNWSFNPASHKGKIGQSRQRRDFWMTMETLQGQYASTPPVGTTPVSPSSVPTKEPQCSP